MRRTMHSVIAGIMGGLITLAGLYFFSPRFKKPAKGPEVTARMVNQKVNTNPRLKNINFDFTAAAEEAMPVVVHISAVAGPRRNNGMRQQLPNDPMFDPFRQFFGDDFFFDFPLDLGPQQGTGSGVIISPDGYIVTNNHVIDFAREIEVTLFDGNTYTAAVVGVDPRTDLAVLKIDERNLPTIEYANSEHAKVGEWVLAVGNPFDLTSTVTAGIISAKGRDIDVIRRNDAIENFIQTDAAVNPGNSGGALVNIEGKLLGINTAIASPTGAFAGYSFAIPANMVKDIVQNIIEHGGPRPQLGINVMDIDEELVEEYNLNVSEGVFVDEVVDGSAAQFAGILPNDVILKVNGIKVKNAPELVKILETTKVGDTLHVTINRKGSIKEVPVRLKAG